MGRKTSAQPLHSAQIGCIVNWAALIVEAEKMVEELGGDQEQGA